MKKTATIILNRNLPKVTDALVEHLKKMMVIQQIFLLLRQAQIKIIYQNIVHGI